MKIQCILAMGGAMLFSPVLLADTSIDPEKLGYMKGVLDACGKAAPQEASAYLLQIKSYIGDATKDTVNSAMRTDEYRQAYASIHSRLQSEMGMLSRDAAAAACTSYLNN